MVAEERKGKQFIEPYYVIGNWHFDNTETYKIVSADTETKMYLDSGELLDENEATRLGKEKGQAYIKEHVIVKPWAYTIAYKSNFACFGCIEDFMTACSLIEAENVIWYNARFDFAIFDYYFLTKKWELLQEEVKEFQERKVYRKARAYTYSSMQGTMGQRYKLEFWFPYINKQRHRKVHRTTMTDLCNVIQGGLAKNLKGWDIKDDDGNEIRKLEMNYDYATLKENASYLYNDTVGLYYLAEKVDQTLYELSGLSFFESNYLTAGGLAKKTLLESMYGLHDFKKNLACFQDDFPMTLQLDKMLRQHRLYRGGLTILNPAYQGKIVKNVYKYDENSMYPDKMFHMKQLRGNPRKVDDYEYKADKVQIIAFRNLDGIVKADKIAVWQNTEQKRYFSDTIDEHNELYMFAEEYEELLKWYTIVADIKFVWEYDCMENTMKDYVDKFYTLKRESKGVVRNACKLFLNSAYGKLAEEAEKEKVEYQLNEQGISHLVNTGSTAKEKDLMNVILGAYVTALARVDILSSIRKCCNENVKDNFIYCDTDSIHCFTDNIETDDKELGKFKNEGKDGKPFEKAIYYAPKTYAMLQDGEVELHCKGVQVQAVKDMVKGMEFEDMIKIFKPNYPILSLTGINVKGGKALIRFEKYIMRDEKKGKGGNIIHAMGENSDLLLEP